MMFNKDRKNFYLLTKKIPTHFRIGISLLWAHRMCPYSYYPNFTRLKAVTVASLSPAWINSRTVLGSAMRDT